MSRAEANATVTAGLILFLLVILVIGWLGDKTGVTDALGLRPTSTPTIPQPRRH